MGPISRGPGRSTLTLLGACLLLSWVVGSLAQPARAATTLSWSTPAPLYGGSSSTGAPTAIACPSQTMCVVVDDKGNVLVSDDPGSSRPSWTVEPIDPGHALNAVSCVSTTLCVAVDDVGQVFTSVTPGGGVSAWLHKEIDATESLNGVSCPSATLCVAVDGTGKAFVSGDPGTAGSSWAGAPIDSGHALRAISCVSSTLCVAVDDAGNVLASANPSESGSWHARATDPTPDMSAVSCSPTGVCVAVDGAGNALASSDPTASQPTWSSTGIDPLGDPEGVSCPANGPCVIVDKAGGSFASEAPALPAPTWASSSVESGVPLVGVACVPGAFCVAIDADGHTLSATTLTPSPAPVPTVGVMVQPNPSIVGIPAVGERLRCLTGVAEGAPATFSYTWLRDESPIPSANTSSYKVGSADATHHLQCQVIATNAAGSVSAHSAFVAIPAQGVLAAVGETTVGAVQATHGRVSVPVTCSAQASHGCVLTLRLTAVESVRDGHILALSSHSLPSLPGARNLTLALGSASAGVAAGKRIGVSVALNATGRRLLARFGRLPLTFTLKGTVIGVLDAQLLQRRLALHVASGARASHLPNGSGPTIAATPAIAASPTTSAPVGGPPPVATAASRAPAAGSATAESNAAGAGNTSTVLTPTPYMGWDSYFAFGGRYSEATILQQASEMISLGLEKHGYRYVWLDAGWWQGARGEHGEIEVNRKQWPHGMAWLASTLHEAGFRVGLYTDAGREGCGGVHEGSYGHYQQDANTFAAWGFDAVKVDFCGGVRQHLNPKAAYTSFHDAVQANSSHRQMLLSICNFLEPGQENGNPPYAESAFSSYTFGPSVGNSWRTDTDVGSPGYVTFATVLRNLDADAAHPEAAGPGHWNDPDYLGPDQGLSAAQFDTQMSMWAILAAPLMVSDNLTQMSTASLHAVESGEVIAIDQDPAGIQGKLLSTAGGGEVWVKPLSNGSRAVALLNRGSTPLSIATSANAIGMPSAKRYELHNVWTSRTEATAGSIAAEVPGESTVLLRVSLTP